MNLTYRKGTGANVLGFLIRKRLPPTRRLQSFHLCLFENVLLLGNR